MFEKILSSILQTTVYTKGVFTPRHRALISYEQGMPQKFANSFGSVCFHTTFYLPGPHETVRTTPCFEVALPETTCDQEEKKVLSNVSMICHSFALIIPSP